MDFADKDNLRTAVASGRCEICGGQRSVVIKQKANGFLKINGAVSTECLYSNQCQEELKAAVRDMRRSIKQ